MNIRLCIMTKELARQFYQGFEYDPIIFMDGNQFSRYEYSPEKSDAHWQRQQDLGRIELAIMLEDDPVGEVCLKNLNHEKKSCELSIHMKNDSVKGKGYGTQAEILALEYAFDELGMNTVFADVLLKNLRSQHVLKKAGFVETHRDETFYYYRCNKDIWKRPKFTK